MMLYRFSTGQARLTALKDFFLLNKNSLPVGKTLNFYFSYIGVCARLQCNNAKQTVKGVSMKKALVVEGGGMRGIFSAGILDAFLETGFDPFDLYIGVSAGSCNLGSFLAGQHRRNYRIYTGMMTDPRFISAKKFFMGGHWMDLDWLWEKMSTEDPMDAEGAENHLKKKKGSFLIVATDVQTGMPLYLEGERNTMFQYMKASSAVPVLYRGSVDTGEKHAVDGGVADAIPARKAYELGARKIMVLRSRPREYRKSKDLETLVMSLTALNRPRLMKAMIHKPDQYMDSVSFIRTPPADAAIIEINPPETMKTGRTSKGTDGLDNDYREGMRIGIDAVNEWNKKQRVTA